MNLFLPEDNIVESIVALDNRRLIKQILECKTILDVAVYGKNGYAKHPVVAYYKDYPKFVSMYSSLCVWEYKHRFYKDHRLTNYFNDISYMEFPNNVPQPFYCEGLKTDPNCIRTTQNTVELFRQKLCKKWDNDKYPPKWTNRQSPEWYQEHSNKKV